MKTLTEQYSDLVIQTFLQRSGITFGDYFTNRSFEFCQSEFKMSSSLASSTNMSFIPAKVCNDILSTEWEIWLIFFVVVVLIPTGSRQLGICHILAITFLLYILQE